MNKPAPGFFFLNHFQMGHVNTRHITDETILKDFLWLNERGQGGWTKLMSLFIYSDLHEFFVPIYHAKNLHTKIHNTIGESKSEVCEFPNNGGILPVAGCVIK